MQARVDGIDKFDNNVIALDCPSEDFRSIEASLYQVLHRTSSNEPLFSCCSRREDRKDLKHGMQLREGTIRGTCQTKKSAHAALVSNISERDREKCAEQFDDILRTFTNEMNKFENRFGKIRDDACRQEIDAKKLPELQVPRDDDVVQ